MQAMARPADAVVIIESAECAVLVLVYALGEAAETQVTK